MLNIELNIDPIFDFISKEEVNELSRNVAEAHKALVNGSGRGNEYTGWLTLPTDFDKAVISSIIDDANYIGSNSEIMVVVGIGGSYLGARAVIEALSHHFPILMKSRKAPLIVYAGHNISEDYLSDLLDVLNEKDYSLAVISKSGTTTEPAIAFRVLKKHLESKYGKSEAARRIFAITDKSKGALKKLADEEGYKTYVVPDNIGGRYSVLTPVGLLPIAIAGFDIDQLIKGAQAAQQQLLNTASFDENPAALYAAARNALYRNGKTTEILVNYLPSLNYFTEWWKQLYGESEGKENKGIFPAGVGFTTDLHSMGQYIQEGLRNIFETALLVKDVRRELKIPLSDNDLDGLNYIAGKRMQEVNEMAEVGTMLAHLEGGVPNMTIKIPVLNEYHLGELIYFFELACAISGYILKVNPFDQPGVEAYKNNMFALLGKPGFEKQTSEIKKRIGK